MKANLTSSVPSVAGSRPANPSMSSFTASLLSLAESVGRREEFLMELAPLVADKLYFSPESVAMRYDVSLSCVKNWRSTGVLIPSLKVPGGTARYTLSDLKRFEEAGKAVAK